MGFILHQKKRETKHTSRYQWSEYLQYTKFLLYQKVLVSMLALKAGREEILGRLIADISTIESQPYPKLIL